MSLSPRQIQRRERILNTVRQQLSKGGYEQLSMRDVASASGVSPTTLYNLYENKDGLVLAALRDLLAHLAESFDGTLRGMERLIDRTEVIGQQIVKTPRYAEAMMRMLFNSDSADPIAEVLLHDAIRANLELIEEMQALGEIRRDIDGRLFARNLAGNRWATLLLWAQGYIALQSLVEEYVRSELLTLAPVMTPKATRRYLPRALAAAELRKVRSA